MHMTYDGDGLSLNDFPFNQCQRCRLGYVCESGGGGGGPRIYRGKSLTQLIATPNAIRCQRDPNIHHNADNRTVTKTRGVGESENKT